MPRFVALVVVHLCLLLAVMWLTGVGGWRAILLYWLGAAAWASSARQPVLSPGGRTFQEPPTRRSDP